MIRVVLKRFNSAAIEIGIFLSQAVWLYRTRKIRKRMKEAELPWEEFPEAQEWQSYRWRWKNVKSVIAPPTALPADDVEGQVEQEKV